MNVQKVIFMVNETYGDVFAYLPKENEFKRNINSTCQNNIDANYIKESRIVKYSEYFYLKKELENNGYELQIING